MWSREGGREPYFEVVLDSFPAVDGQGRDTTDDGTDGNQRERGDAGIPRRSRTAEGGTGSSFWAGPSRKSSEGRVERVDVRRVDPTRTPSVPSQWRKREETDLRKAAWAIKTLATASA